MENVRVGTWEMNIGEIKKVNGGIIRALEKFLTREWKEAVLEGVDQPWWSVQNLGIPSPIVRVDMAPALRAGTVRNYIYEIEVRPGGLGILLYLMPERIRQWKKILSMCKGFVSIESSIQDDKLVTDLLNIPYYEEVPTETEGPYWIRSNQRDGKVASLEKISLVPIKLDGDKTYLVKLKMAEKLDKERFNWFLPFVVKPLVGSKMKGVEIYLPSALKKELGAGSSTRSRILRTISNGEPYIIQRFILPKEEWKNNIKGWTIWRLFFGWEDNKYQFAGGLWNWRPTLRVHGASDAIMGSIKIDE
ncbi:MAG TPA: hypothetical protein PLL80_02250 [Candidatus Pacearchaeota archaeon]|nr:hypothetical protein [Candidatus Pacearchaeota archaeon]HOK94211.1 hypothetical protein [Candidatus Pacearchaeota archaeon]HPO75405.1 hypothetical protein [Candidatus Pacearchaeota archaeon]